VSSPDPPPTRDDWSVAQGGRSGELVVRQAPPVRIERTASVGSSYSARFYLTVA